MKIILKKPTASFEFFQIFGLKTKLRLINARPDPITVVTIGPAVGEDLYS